MLAHPCRPRVRCTMKLKISASTDKLADLPWPDGVPLPPAGSQVVMMHEGQRISFVVDRCEFDLTDSASQVGSICVRGHHHTPGLV
jgi:hypothetical protein